MGKRVKRPVLLVDLDGILCQWQKWEGEKLFGLPIDHNIVQVTRWYAAHPGGRILVRVAPGKPRKGVLKQIRQWLKDHNVIYSELSMKEELPEHDDHWWYKGKRVV